MAFIRRKTDQRGLPRVIEEFGLFYVRDGFYHANLKEKAEALCHSLNSHRAGAEGAHLKEYVMTSSGGLRLAARDSDDNLRSQMDLILSGDRQSAKAQADHLRALLTGGEA